MLKCCICQAHRDAFFTRLHRGKGAVCQDRAFLGLDGESAGGNGKSGNPMGCLKYAGLYDHM